MNLLQGAAIRLPGMGQLAILLDAGSIPELLGIRVEFILFAEGTRSWLDLVR